MQSRGIIRAEHKDDTNKIIMKK